MFAIGGLKEITVDSDIDFSLRKVVIGEVIGKKICLTDEAIRNTMERCDGSKKCCIVQNLKEKTSNILHVNVFFVSFSKGSSNTLLRFAESQ